MKGAKKPEFKEDYSVEKSKGKGKSARGKQATGRKPQDEKQDQVSRHLNLDKIGGTKKDCIEQGQQFAWRFIDGRAAYVCYHLYGFARRSGKVLHAEMPLYEQTLIRLQNELVRGIDALFIFVAHPEVEPTHNRSERNVRREAEVRKGGRTSKSESGAKRRGIMMTVLATLDTRFERFTVDHLMDEMKRWTEVGFSTFQAELTKIVNPLPPLIG